MSVTNFMNMDLPTVSVTLGPDWADELNAALEVVDAHDHSSGKGAPVPVSGLNINADLNFEENRAYNLDTTQYIAQAATLSGPASIRSIYVYGGNLYYVNGSGVNVQLTDGGSPVTVPGTVQTLERTEIAGDLSIGPADTFVEISVDTAGAREITLPLASAVSAGRLYIVKDRTGQSTTNAITVTCQGSDTLDLEASQDLASELGSWMIIGNGSNAWEII